MLNDYIIQQLLPLTERYFTQKPEKGQAKKTRFQAVAQLLNKPMHLTPHYEVSQHPQGGYCCNIGLVTPLLGTGAQFTLVSIGGSLGGLETSSLASLKPLT